MKTFKWETILFVSICLWWQIPSEIFASEKALNALQSVDIPDALRMDFSILLYLCVGALGGEWDFLQTTILTDKMWHVC